VNEEPQFRCIICSGPFEKNPRLEALIFGKPNMQRIGQMCWICARLTISLMQEAAQMEKEMAE
jgi:hypothetical protein